MHKQVEAHIETVVNEIRSLLMAAAERIEKLQVDGPKLTQTQLADDLAKERGKKRSDIYPTMHLLMDNYPNVLITAGKGGGIKRVKSWDDESKAKNEEIK